MSKIRITNRYGVTPNSLLNNEEISLKAKGLYAFIQSKPDDWDFSALKISSQCKEGLDAIRLAIIELEKFGYLVRQKNHNEKGFWEIDYILYETPIKEEPTLENPTKDNTQNNSKKDLSKKESSNKECEKSENHTHDSNSNSKSNTLNKNTTSVSNSTRGAVAVGGETEENDTYVPNFLKPTQKVFKFYIARQFNEEIIGFDSVMSFMQQHFEISLKTLSFNYDKFMPQIVKDFEKLNTGKIWKNKEDLRSHFSNYCHKWTPKANTVEPIRKRRMITEND